MLLARATGDPVETVMRDRIFEPLGMPDTGFTVPADQRAPAHDRLPTRRRRPARSRCSTTPADSWWSHAAAASRRQRLAGLDHRRLLGVRVDGARPAAPRGGRRVLSPESVALMTTDRLTAPQRDASRPLPGRARAGVSGWRTPAAGTAAPFPCGVGWDGGTGTTWRSDPATGVTGILFTQRRGHVARAAPADRATSGPASTPRPGDAAYSTGGRSSAISRSLFLRILSSVPVGNSSTK